MARSLNKTLQKYYRPGGRKEFLKDMAQTLAMATVTLAVLCMM